MRLPLQAGITKLLTFSNMTSFTINSSEKSEDGVSKLNVSMETESTGQTIDIQVASEDPNFILQQIAMCTEAFASVDGAYYGNGDGLTASVYEELPIGVQIQLN